MGPEFDFPGMWESLPGSTTELSCADNRRQQFDLNQNGIRDPGEPGIPNWPMTLTRVSSEFGQPTGVVVATTTTDSNGNYSFTLAPAPTVTPRAFTP